jgi:DNA-binding CsgD family transcriptional regulator
VIQQGTAYAKTKAYHQLAQTYLRAGEDRKVDIMLDSLYTYIIQNDTPTSVIHIDYEQILNHYIRKRDHFKIERFIQLIIQEQQLFRVNKVNSNLVDAIVDFQTEKRVHEIRIEQLTQANHRLWLTVALAISLLITAVILAYLFYQKNQHKQQMKKADEMLTSLVKKLDESNSVKEKTAQEIKEFLSDKEKRQELETLTPYVLKESGETKFRQCFEMLHPLFLHRLHERVPSVTRREELLSMLIVLKQDNKKIAELLAIAPRSVLMLRHRFRQKIGMDTEYSLENFIDQILGLQDEAPKS